MKLTPWFLGQDGPGLTPKEAAALFGPGVPLVKLPGQPDLDKQKGHELRLPLLHTMAMLNDALKVAPPSAKGWGTLYGVRGIGITWPVTGGKKGEVQVYPFALFNRDAIKELSEEESRNLVQTPATERPRLGLEVIRTELDGASPEQTEDLDPASWWKKLLTWGAPVVGAGAVGGGIYVLTR